MRTRLGTLVTALGLSLALPSGAAAVDNYPCGPPTTVAGHRVRYCPVWVPARGFIPVVRSFGGSPPKPQSFGALYRGGTANWFVCQDDTPGGITPAPYIDPDHPQYVNKWWAWTADDQGGWGWVNLIYFKGGDNHEPDATLEHCDPPAMPQPASAAPPPPTGSRSGSGSDNGSGESPDTGSGTSNPAPEKVAAAAPTAPLTGETGSQVQIPQQRGCTPSGRPLRGSLRVKRKRRGPSPIIRKVVFSVRDVHGQKVSTTVRRPRANRYIGRLVVTLPAGVRARVYARVYYRWKGERRIRTTLVSRLVKICA